jgi:hypothetical protein
LEEGGRGEGGAEEGVKERWVGREARRKVWT